MLISPSQDGRFYLAGTGQENPTPHNMKESATMSENTAPKARKSNQVSTTVSEETFTALENFRWPAHMKMTEVVAEGVDLFIEKHGIVVGEEAATDEAPVAGKPTPKA